MKTPPPPLFLLLAFTLASLVALAPAPAGAATATGIVAPPDAATAAIVDLNSLIATRPADASYTRLSPILASTYPILPNQAVPFGQTATYPVDFARHNYDAQALTGAYRGRPFTVPTGVAAGGIRLALYDLGQITCQGSEPAGTCGATGSVALEVWDSLGLTRWSTTACSVGTNLATCKTAALTGSWLIDGARYQARIAVANGGTQSVFWASRFAVEPVTAGPCGLPATNFVRLDANRQIRGLPSFPDVWSHPDSPDQNAFARWLFQTNAGSLCIEVREGGLVTAAGSNARAAFGVNVAGRAPQLFTPTSLSANNFITASVANGALGAVELVGGSQIESAYLVSAPVPRGDFLVAVYVPQSTYLQALPPSPPLWSARGDSKIIAWTTNPPLNSMAGLLGKRGWSPQWSGIGGQSLAQDVTAASTLGAWPLGQVLCGDPGHAPRVVEAQVRRNDYEVTAYATVISLLGYGLDVTHAQCPGAIVLQPQISNEGTDTYDSTPGSTIRTAERALVGAQGVYDPSGSTRGNWLRLVEVEGDYTAAECAVSSTNNPLATCADTVHPADRGSERTVRGKIASVTGAEEYPVPSFLLDTTRTKIWAETDPDCMNGGGVSAATAGGTSPPSVTITGTGIRAMRLVVEIQTVSGASGTFRWSGDGGVTWTEQGVHFATTGQTVALPTAAGATSLGWSVVFPSGSYSTDNTWTWDAQPTSWGCPGYTALTAASGAPQWSPVNTAFGSVTMAPVPSSGPWGLGRSAWTGSSSVQTEFQITGQSFAPPYSILTVGLLDTQGGVKTLWGRTAAGSSTILYAQSGTTMALYDVATQIVSGTVDATKAHCWAADYRGTAGGNSTLYLDGAVTGTPAVMTGNTTLSGLDMGYDQPNATKVGGTWASLVVVNNSVTPDEVIGYCRRAASKWGTPQWVIPPWPLLALAARMRRRRRSLPVASDNASLRREAA